MRVRGICAGNMSTVQGGDVRIPSLTHAAKSASHPSLIRRDKLQTHRRPVYPFIYNNKITLH